MSLHAVTLHRCTLLAIASLPFPSLVKMQKFGGEREQTAPPWAALVVTAATLHLSLRTPCLFLLSFSLFLSNLNQNQTDLVMRNVTSFSGVSSWHSPVTLGGWLERLQEGHESACSRAISESSWAPRCRNTFKNQIFFLMFLNQDWEDVFLKCFCPDCPISVLHLFGGTPQSDLTVSEGLCLVGSLSPNRYLLFWLLV